MHLIAYASTSKTLLSEHSLELLLHKSRSNNEQHGITGMLLYKEGTFLQVIEGEEAPLRQLYRNISRDPLHFDPIIILDEPVEARSFSHWTMGFLTVSKDPMSPGFTNFLRDRETMKLFAQSANDAKMLLSRFGLELR